MSVDELESELEELESAEDFLGYFGIDFDVAVVDVNRLHILQRFHEYLEGADDIPADPGTRRALYAGLLDGAYQDFVKSDARTEKVFRVFHMQERGTAKIDLSDLIAQLRRAS